MQKKGKIIPEMMRLPLFAAVACNMIAYYGARLLTSGRIHYDISTALDARIPFVPWTVAIYAGAYFFWAANYVIGCRQTEEEAFRFLSADFAAKLVCLVCFLVFPTTNVRPEVGGMAVWDRIMRMLYRADAPDNLFPSIHCLTSWFAFLAVRNNPRTPVWYRVFSLLAALAVCVSTLTTKQHVLADVAAGIALAEGSYLFVKRSGFSGFYADVMRRLRR